jgi:hypothetical protein
MITPRMPTSIGEATIDPPKPIVGESTTVR